MLITRIRAKNFKTYKDLDLNLNVEEGKPIILIGGMNGGGKTTLFQAIYHALYGLKIKDSKHFKELLNASVPLQNNTLIELDIDFTGKVLMSDFSYRITRTYGLNLDNKPVESVSLNFNGDIFTYGPTKPISERAKGEDEVNKIIKSNLPKELSRYFLFDAMESGKLLEEGSLASVIKENIESVMGFNKYIELGEAATKLKETYIKESLEEQEEKREYESLLNKKEEIENNLLSMKEKRQMYLSFSVDNKDLYLKAKEGKDLQDEYKERIKYLTSKIDNIKNKEKQYIDLANKFVEKVELYVFLPNLVDSIKDELELIISSTKSTKSGEQLSKKQINFVVEKLIEYLKQNKTINEVDVNLLDKANQFILEKQKEEVSINAYSYFSEEELNTIQDLLNTTSINAFLNLEQNKNNLINDLKELPKYEQELEQMKNHLSSADNYLIEDYEKNENMLIELKANIIDLETELSKVENQINNFDISASSTVNPKLEEIIKIEPLFEKISSALLKEKKKSIEETLCKDLNATLTVYLDQIDRVELSDERGTLTFKMYHKKGNEIYLNQLNAASKQVLVQVLLKSLHQFGDYDPPVMIDTVMGYLDFKTRDLLLQNYFPQLSHQTILLSTDSEISVEKDLPKIENYVSRKYTLLRDIAAQQTSVIENYFNH